MNFLTGKINKRTYCQTVFEKTGCLGSVKKLPIPWMTAFCMVSVSFSYIGNVTTRDLMIYGLDLFLRENDPKRRRSG